MKHPVVPKSSLRPILLNHIESGHLQNAEILKALPRLSNRDAMALIKAARLYQDAIWIAEDTPELSWIMLTSAIETVASRWRSEKESNVDRMRTSRPELEQLLLAAGGEELVLQVSDQIAAYMGATKTFTDFILNFLPEPPEKRPSAFVQLSWEETSMKKAIQKIYSYRSRALHGGTPFPAPMCMSPEKLGRGDSVPAETPSPVNSGMGTMGSVWLSKDTPMTLHMFEYITRKSIIKWWNSRIESSSSSF